MFAVPGVPLYVTVIVSVAAAAIVTTAPSLAMNPHSDPFTTVIPSALFSPPASRSIRSLTDSVPLLRTVNVNLLCPSLNVSVPTLIFL